MAPQVTDVVPGGPAFINLAYVIVIAILLCGLKGYTCSGTQE